MESSKELKPNKKEQKIYSAWGFIKSSKELKPNKNKQMSNDQSTDTQTRKKIPPVAFFLAKLSSNLEKQVSVPETIDCLTVHSQTEVTTMQCFKDLASTAPEGAPALRCFHKGRNTQIMPLAYHWWSCPLGTDATVSTCLFFFPRKEKVILPLWL